jgi:hypothetical protein
LAGTGCVTPAVAPVNVEEGDRIELAISNGEPVAGATYEWVQTGDGPRVEIQNGRRPVTYVKAPEGLKYYRLTFMRIRHLDGKDQTDNLEVWVRADDDLPLADAGESRTVDEGSETTLFGVGRDPERSEVNFRWLQTAGPQVKLSDPARANPTFTAPNVTALDTLVFELRVSDGVNTSVPSEISIAVRPVNSLPVADAGVDQTVREGQQVTLSGSGEDADGGSLTFRWHVLTQEPQVTLDAPDARQASFVAPKCPGDADAYALEFELTVQDPDGSSSTDRMVVTVSAINVAPVATAGADIEATEGDVIRLLGSGRDPEGAALTYAWRQSSGDTEVTLLDPQTSEPSFLAPGVPTGRARISLNFALTVSDGVNTSESSFVQVLVNRLPEERKLHALAPGEVDPLFGPARIGFLDRWEDAQIASDDAEVGFVADAARKTLLARFRSADETLDCRLPPGSWRLEGSIDLREVESRGQTFRGASLIFDTGTGSGAALGLVSLGGKVGIQVRELDWDADEHEWAPDRSTLRLLQGWPLNQPLYFAVSWKDSRLRFQWSDAEVTVLERPERRIELRAAPSVLTLTVDHATTAAQGLQLVGI